MFSATDAANIKNDKLYVIQTITMQNRQNTTLVANHAGDGRFVSNYKIDKNNWALFYPSLVHP
jgi:hypothetical protein